MDSGGKNELLAFASPAKLDTWRPPGISGTKMRDLDSRRPPPFVKGGSIIFEAFWAGWLCQASFVSLLVLLPGQSFPTVGWLLLLAWWAGETGEGLKGVV